ncbi:9644_t:CDS:2 [Funneliformis geosporum]|nr:9644_t:CDS:2 [Funneliformis geosporum]
MFTDSFERNERLFNCFGLLHDLKTRKLGAKSHLIASLNRPKTKKSRVRPGKGIKPRVWKTFIETYVDIR